MAEPSRGAPYRLHPARMSESRPRPWRTAPAPHPGSLLRVLSPGAYSLRQAAPSPPHLELHRFRSPRCLIVSWRSWAYRDSIGHRQPSRMSFWRRAGPRWSARSATELAPEADAGLELQLRDRLVVVRQEVSDRDAHGRFG